MNTPDISRRFDGKRMVVASHNAGKVSEISDLLSPLGIEIISAISLGLPVPDETGTTFEANAMLKAKSASLTTGLVSLADDSGLCVDILSGAPGVYTADWAGESRDFCAAMRRVEDEMRLAGATDASQRTASFISVLVLAWPDGYARSFFGEVTGRIVYPPRGDLGFGYDPCFQPDGFVHSFGEMSAAEKHSWHPGIEGLSHRARAFANLWYAALKPQN